MRALIWILAIAFLILVLMLAYGASQSNPKTYGDISRAAAANCMRREESEQAALAAGMNQVTYCQMYGRQKASQIWGEDHRDFR